MASGYNHLGLSTAGLRSPVSMLGSTTARKRDKDKRRTRKVCSFDYFFNNS